DCGLYNRRRIRPAAAAPLIPQVTARRPAMPAAAGGQHGPAPQGRALAFGGNFRSTATQEPRFPGVQPN
ncbi:MAG: hypothetical protein ACRDOB_00215, partial [Streptosporangiaceae bacterium]